MDQSLEVTNVKNESTNSTSSDRLKILTEIQTVKQESDCLVQSQIYIKTEPQEDECRFQVIVDSSYELCPYNKSKFEMEEPVIKIKREDLEHEIMQDPLDVGDEIKAEEHFPIKLELNKSGMKTEATQGQNDEHLFETDKNNSHWSGSNEDQLLNGNDSDFKSKQHICHVCSKIFTQKNDLARHLRIHSGEKAFNCDVCEKSFYRKDALNTHILVHNGKKPHVCDICNKHFSQKSTLNHHKLVHSDERPFSCKECNKSFIQKTSLVRHERMHTGEKPFSCEMCEKAFTQKSDLTIHKRIHTGEKPYCCTVCIKSFTTKRTLNIHKKMHND